VNLTSRTQIDRLGDRLRKGNPAEDDLHRLDEYRRSFAEAYEEVVSLVRRATGLEPTGRPAKSTTSIIEKLQRETMRLSQMQDIAGCRLVVQDILAQDSVVAELKAVLPGADVIDRRKYPSHGYRAVHIIAIAKGKPVEIQVRTELQHLWAQLSEKASDVFDPAVKYGGGPAEVPKFMSMVSERIASLEAREVRSSLDEESVRVRNKFRQDLEDAIAELEDLSEEPTGG